MGIIVHSWRICLRYGEQKFTRWLRAETEQDACDNIRIAYPEDRYSIVSVEPASC